MQFISLTTDYGLNSGYVAQIKNELNKSLSLPVIIDISHLIEPFNLLQAAYIVRTTYKNFPENSIHFIGVDFNQNPEQDIIVTHVNKHYFVCADNGFLSLLEPKFTPNKIVKLNLTHQSNILNGVQAIAHIYRGGNVNLIGTKKENLKQLKPHRAQFSEDNTLINGHVIHIDRYGNIITNITKDFFQECCRNRTFTIYARNHSFNEVYQNYHDAIKFNIKKELREEDGKKLALFNDEGFLEIAIYKGNPNFGGGASSLFGIHFLDPIRVKFNN